MFPTKTPFLLKKGLSNEPHHTCHLSPIIHHSLIHRHFYFILCSFFQVRLEADFGKESLICFGGGRRWEGGKFILGASWVGGGGGGRSLVKLVGWWEGWPLIKKIPDFRSPRLACPIQVLSIPICKLILCVYNVCFENYED